MITEHLLRLGSRRIAFVAMPHAAATVDAREAGYREALYAAGRTDRPRADRAASIRPTPPRCAPSSISPQPDAIVCANDRTAARLMPTLLRLGYRDSRPTSASSASTTSSIAGLLPVPLDHAAAADATDRRRGAWRDARTRRPQRLPAARRAAALRTRRQGILWVMRFKVQGSRCRVRVQGSTFVHGSKVQRAPTAEVNPEPDEPEPHEPLNPMNPEPAYSCRSAVAGLTRATRRAGSRLASRAMVTRMVAVAA